MSRTFVYIDPLAATVVRKSVTLNVPTIVATLYLVLKSATQTTIGAVKPGAHLSVESNGTLNVDTGAADTDIPTVETVKTLDGAVKALVTAEETARQSGDQGLSTRIVSEVVDRQSADTTLQNNINAEESARESADTAMQENISDLQDVTPSTQGTDGQYLKSNGIGNKPTWATFGNIYTYKGSVETYAELPATGNVIGDVWNVVEAYLTYPAGTNFAWNGTTWDALGGSIDTTGFIRADGTVPMVANYTPTADSQEVATAQYVDDSVAVEASARENADTNVAYNAKQYNVPLLGSAYTNLFANIYASREYISNWLNGLTYVTGAYGGYCELLKGTSQGAEFGTPGFRAYNNATDASGKTAKIIIWSDGGDTSDPGDAIIIWSERAGTFAFGDWSDISTTYAGWNYGTYTAGGVSHIIVDDTTGQTFGISALTVVNALIDGVISPTAFQNGIKFGAEYAQFVADASIPSNVFEQISILTTDWLADATIEPFAYKCTKTLTTTLETDDVLSLSMNVVTQAATGTVIADITGQVLTIYCMELPTATIVADIIIGG